MSLDNFQLPPFLIHELYKDSLIHNGVLNANTPVLKGMELPFLGDNAKNILVLVDEKEAVYLNDEDLALLTGILMACNVLLTDIALVNQDKNPGIEYKRLMQSFKPSIVLFFGTDPVKLQFPLNFPHYQVQRYNNQTYLSSPSLKLLSVDLEEKRKLWASLQKLFSIYK
ncbi:MAG: hypothetical protein ABIO04_00560 [Ferruginibacter sp.]